MRPILCEIGHGFDSDTWMELYTAVYKLCSNPTLPRHRDLYFRLRAMLIEFTSDFCEELQSVLERSPPSEVFLKKYCMGFEQYSIGMKYGADMFSYLDRYWIRENHFDVGENPTEHVYYVWELALHMWKEQVYDQLNFRIRQSVMSMLGSSRKERVLSMQNADILRRLMQTYVLLGFENRERSELFRLELEEPMVRDAEDYYKAVGSDLLQYLDVSEYLMEIEKLLDEEEVRCKMCLNRESVRRVRKAVETALVVHPLDRVLEEARNMLRASPERVEDLRRMYRLIQDISDDGIKSLQDVVREHIQAQGLKVVKSFDLKTEWNEEKQGEMPPEQVVNAILDVYWHYHKIVKDAFMDSKGFLAVLEQAARVFVNAIDGAPEMLAQFSHSILDRTVPASRIAEDQRQEALGRVAFLFQFVGDKDIFQKFYSKLLARRLAEETSVSDEAEELMLEKLKEAAGFEFTSGLQRMFVDKSMSQELNREYQGWLSGIIPVNSTVNKHSNDKLLGMSSSGGSLSGAAAKQTTKKKGLLGRLGLGKKRNGGGSPKASDKRNFSGGEDARSHHSLCVKPKLEGYSFILTAGTWPVKAKDYTIRIPVIIQDYITSFTTFYNETYSGRRLKYLYHLGHAEVMSKCFESKYFFVVSTYQMIVLYEFNRSDALSLQELCDSVKIDAAEMTTQLVPLLRTKILAVKGIANFSANDNIEADDVIQVNTSFQSKRTKIKVPTAEPKKTPKVKNLEVREELIADRKMVTQAAIVRTMKARKILSHSSLVAEVTAQVSRLYIADLKFIKQQIEDLIEKDFIERQEGTDSYSYID